MSSIYLKPITKEMYREYAKEYENAPDLYLDMWQYQHYEYSVERADNYVQRYMELTCA